jgi:hypothetical protein
MFLGILESMNPNPREMTLIESGLSHAQARKMTLEFSDRGIGVECRPSRSIGWDVWTVGSPAQVSGMRAVAADD